MKVFKLGGLWALAAALISSVSISVNKFVLAQVSDLRAPEAS